MKTRWFLLPLAVCMVALSVSGQAQTGGQNYYVSTTGNNANPGTIDSPWRTVAYAVSQGSPVQAGDTIHVRAGVYAEAIMLQKSGAIGNPITLKAYDGEDCDFTTVGSAGCRGGEGSAQHARLTTGDGNAVINLNSEKNWVIDGFEICCMPNAGGAASGIYTPATNVGSENDTLTIRNNLIYNFFPVSGNTGNAGGIHLTDYRGIILIQNNKIHSIYGNAAPWNSVGILYWYRTTYGTTTQHRITIEHNEIWDTAVGIKEKQDSGVTSCSYVNQVHRYNFIHNTHTLAGAPTRAVMVGTDCLYSHHNIVAFVGTSGEGQGGIVTAYDNAGNTGGGSNNATIEHNTVYNADFAVMVGNAGWNVTGNTVRNNILYSYPNSTSGGVCGADQTQRVCGTGVQGWITPLSSVTLNYNLYYGQGTGTVAQFNGAAYTASSLRAAGAEANGRFNQDPLFVSSTPTVAADFKLQSGSPARNAASEGSGHALGAYETGNECIGVMSACNDTGGPSGPASPTNLRIVP